MADNIDKVVRVVVAGDASGLQNAAQVSSESLTKIKEAAAVLKQALSAGGGDLTLKQVKELTAALEGLKTGGELTLRQLKQLDQFAGKSGKDASNAMQIIRPQSAPRPDSFVPQSAIPATPAAPVDPRLAGLKNALEVARADLSPRQVKELTAALDSLTKSGEMSVRQLRALNALAKVSPDAAKAVDAVRPTSVRPDQGGFVPFKITGADPATQADIDRFNKHKVENKRISEEVSGSAAANLLEFERNNEARKAAAIQKTTEARRDAEMAARALSAKDLESIEREIASLDKKIAKLKVIGDLEALKKARTDKEALEGARDDIKAFPTQMPPKNPMIAALPPTVLADEPFLVAQKKVALLEKQLVLMRLAGAEEEKIVKLEQQRQTLLGHINATLAVRPNAGKKPPEEEQGGGGLMELIFGKGAFGAGGGGGAFGSRGIQGTIGSLLAGPLGRLAAGFGLVGGAALLAQQGVKKFAEEQEALSNLDLSLSKAQQFSAGYRAELVELSKEMRNVTGTAKNEWLEVFGKLTGAGAKSDNIKSFADDVQNLAGIMGGDVKAATDIVTKSLKGNFDGYKDLNIVIRDNMSISDQLTSIHQQLAEQGGGLLAKSNSTLSGQWREMKEAMGQLLATMGVAGNETGLLERTMYGLTTTARWLSESQTDAAKSTSNLANATTSAVPAYIEAAQSAKTLADSQRTLKEQTELANTMLRAQLDTLREIERAELELIDAEAALAIARVNADEKADKITKEEAIRQRARIKQDAEYKKVSKQNTADQAEIARRTVDVDSAKAGTAQAGSDAGAAEAHAEAVREKNRREAAARHAEAQAAEDKKRMDFLMKFREAMEGRDSMDKDRAFLKKHGQTIGQFEDSMGPLEGYRTQFASKKKIDDAIAQQEIIAKEAARKAALAREKADAINLDPQRPKSEVVAFKEADQAKAAYIEAQRNQTKVNNENTIAIDKLRRAIETRTTVTEVKQTAANIETDGAIAAARKEQLKKDQDAAKKFLSDVERAEKQREKNADEGKPRDFGVEAPVLPKELKGKKFRKGEDGEITFDEEKPPAKQPPPAETPSSNQPSEKERYDALMERLRMERDVAAEKAANAKTPEDRERFSGIAKSKDASMEANERQRQQSIDDEVKSAALRSNAAAQAEADKARAAENLKAAQQREAADAEARRAAREGGGPQASVDAAPVGELASGTSDMGEALAASLGAALANQQEFVAIASDLQKGFEDLAEQVANMRS